jgi:antitoxin (DNA-binding transcriptional repressor) of toxin-antitoxin stability system
MSKRITVEELAANLREHLEEVRAGETLAIVEEEQEIARLAPVPYVESLIRPPKLPGRFQDVPIGPRPKNLRTDPAQIIIDERDYERSEKRWRS